ncbi:MAG: hypothetical protein O6944_02150 [Gammaproteobacteria bacterium]|nr:hypothetical protein [Gammaproteobacteria bacterium]
MNSHASTRQYFSLTHLLAWMLIMMIAAAPAHAGSKSKDREAEEESIGNVLKEPLERIPGPRRSVAVASFGATSAFLSQYGVTDVGGGVAAMLTTALIESGQFVVVERARLSSVLAEQELGANGLINGDSRPSLGQLVGAQLLILGEVTTFEQTSKGRGFSIGIGLGKKKRLGLSPRSQTGVVGIDVRIVDTTTAEVISAFHVEKEAKSKAVALNFSADDLSLGNSNFHRTPLGKVAREAVNDIAQRFAQTAADQPWIGNIVDVDRGEVVINAGARSGIRTGDKFLVYRIAKVLTDPATGEVLGQRTSTIGSMMVVDVQDKIAFGSYRAIHNVIPRRGDSVVQIGKDW